MAGDEVFHSTPLTLRCILKFEHPRPSRIGIQHNTGLNHRQTPGESFDSGKQNCQIGRPGPVRRHLRNCTHCRKPFRPTFRARPFSWHVRQTKALATRQVLGKHRMGAVILPKGRPLPNREPGAQAPRQHAVHFGKSRRTRLNC